MPRFSACLFVLLTANLALAGDWPQWLGPNRDCSTTETVAPWKKAPEVVWRQPVGEGHSSPIVAAGKMFLHSKVKDKDEEEVQVLDAASGKPIWSASYPRGSFNNIFGNGPRATPTFRDGKLYSFGVTGILSCLDAANGKIDWQVDTVKKFDAPRLFFGASCSPLVEGNRVMVEVGAKGASVVAFQKEAGEIAWKALDDRASYSSPIAIDQAGKRQAIFLTQQGLVSLSPDDGTLYWKQPLVDALSESSSTPVLAGDILVGSSITFGSLGVRLEAEDGHSSAKVAWKNPELNCYFATPVLVGKQYLYFVTGTKPPALSIQSTLHCVDVQTGKDLWKKPKIGKYHASLMRTGDAKLLLLDDSGNLALVDPDPKGYRELAKSKVCGEDTWAHPALANGRLYVRDRKELICLRLEH